MPFPNKATQIKPGEVRNPKGNGADHHSTRTIDSWINKLLNDETFKTLIREGMEFKEYEGAPIKAIIAAQIHLAVNGDTKAADLLFKHGSVKKTEIDITSNGETVNQATDMDMLTQFMMQVKNDTKQ